MDIEQQAQELGWVPQERFRGDPEKWVDAATFVERGETVMPILKANNARLKADLDATRSEVASVKASLAEAVEAMTAFKEYASDASKRAYEQAVKDLKAQKLVALENGDHAAVMQADDALADLRETAPKALEKATALTMKETKVPTPQGGLDPADYNAWKEDNDWVETDKEKTAYAASIGAYVKSMNPSLQGRAFLDKIAEEVAERFGKSTPVNRVEGGSRTTSRGGKSFDALPADAKAACDRFGSKMVGVNKAFKTQAEWRAHYVQNYAWE